MDAHVNNQVFALVVWRYYNTKDAWERHRPLLIQFATDEDVKEFKTNIEGIYNDNKEKSYHFATSDGWRKPGGAGS